MKVTKPVVGDVEQTKRQYLHPNATASTHATTTTTTKATATTINSTATTTFATTQAKGIRISSKELIRQIWR